MKSSNSEFRNAIVRSIGVGEDKAIKIKDLIENRLSSFRKESQDSFDSFKKNASRIITSILDDEGEGLCRVKKGNAYWYYWTSQKDKDDAVEQFEMSEERAFAFAFIKEYLPELIPPHIFSALQTEFKRAEEVLDHSELTKYLSKIDFNPMGYDMHSVLDHESATIEERKAWQFVFDCTFEEQCFSANYQSIHKSFDAKELILSPQRIVLLNQHLKVLAHEHNTNTTRYFEIGKLHDLTASKEQFIEVKKTEYETREKISAICHTWVKSNFEATSIADKATFTKLKTDDCWLIEMELSFPIHFNRKEPDPFFIANYLSGFSDSIVVLGPEFLRREMLRRAGSLVQAYTVQTNSELIVSASPKAMTRN
ncbi:MULTISPECIES: WYL domain-containing protein [Alteromonadales]|uniref:WYL domain-containing protein n=1 Tax=Thalassotalea profundi TaxID=2036687 RepID=A0ABQ3IFT4_9GAMM|nr:WYL domain-containing protein [Thalassotalea profundi]GHE78231.1 hypothetical protein GCM10011501_02490 [Thalassotalea profundi]